MFVQRVITRPLERGEAYASVTVAEFNRRKSAGEFVLNWQAHGLQYGIPASECAGLLAGRDVLFNRTRHALPAAVQRFPDLRIILITAPVPMLAERLALRGRETAADIAERLTGAEFRMPGGVLYKTVMNDGTIAVGVARLLDSLQPNNG